MMHDLASHDTPTRMESGRYVLFVLPLLIAVAFVVFGQVIVGNATWASIAYHAEIVPPSLDAAVSMHMGQWPFWWQGIGLGVPLLEHGAYGALYPGTWFAASARSYDVIVLVHLLYFALGTSLWSRERGANELTSALWGAISLVGVPWLWLGHNGALFSWCHLPWIMLVASRFGRSLGGQGGSALCASLLWAAVGLSGQLWFFFGFAALWLTYCISRFRRRALWAISAVVAGMLLSAPQWLIGVLAASHSSNGITSIAGWPILWPGNLESWAQHLWVLAPALAFAPTSLRRDPSLLVFVVGGVGLAVVGHFLFGNVTDVAVALGISAWVAATSTAFSLEQMGTHRVMRLEVPLAAIAMAVVAAQWHAPIHAAMLSLILLLVAVSSWVWIGSHLRWLGVGVLAAVCVMAFAAARATPLVPRAALNEAPVLWPKELSSSTLFSERPVRVLRARHLFDDPTPIDASIRRAHNSLQDAIGSPFGVANVAAGAAYDIRLAAVIAHAAGAMGQFIDRFGIPFAIVPSSAVIPSGLESVATYEKWSLVRTHAARPRAFVTSEVGFSQGDALLRSIFSVGVGKYPISYVSLDETTITQTQRSNLAALQAEVGNIGTCKIELDTATEVALRCRHTTPGLAVLLDAWSPSWRATVDGVAQNAVLADGLARAVFVQAGDSFIVWNYQPAGWRLATYMWWAGIICSLFFTAWWAVNRFWLRRANMPT